MQINLELTFPEAPVFHIEDLDAESRAIHERAIHRAEKYLVSEAELLLSIIEVDQKKLYEKFGLNFLTIYCVKYMKLDETVAGVLVRVARKSQAVPELKTAVISGEVSISNARAISSVITADNHSEWIEKAKVLTKDKLEREVARVSPAKAKPETARHIGNGRVQIVLNLSEEEYEQRQRVQELVSQNLRKNATDSEVEVAMMNCYQFHKDPVRKAERAANRKCKETAASQDVSPKIHEAAHSNDDIPAAVVHAVNLRDRGKCRARNVDGTLCGSTRWPHLHHIIERANGGQHTPENIITLCSSHHRLWHKRHVKTLTSEFSGVAASW